jgi:hypothetical protein
VTLPPTGCQEGPDVLLPDVDCCRYCGTTENLFAGMACGLCKSMKGAMRDEDFMAHCSAIIAWSIVSMNDGITKGVDPRI